MSDKRESGDPREMLAEVRASYPETDGTRKVEWSHRWLTRGHWRNQWFPSEQRHKPIWIADFVKGPADKPFVAKRRAFEFRR